MGPQRAYHIMTSGSMYMPIKLHGAFGGGLRQIGDIMLSLHPSVALNAPQIPHRTLLPNAGPNPVDTKQDVMKHKLSCYASASSPGTDSRGGIAAGCAGGSSRFAGSSSTREEPPFAFARLCRRSSSKSLLTRSTPSVRSNGSGVLGTWACVATSHYKFS